MTFQILTNSGWTPIIDSPANADGWIRPSDWLDLPDISETSSEMHMLVAIYESGINTVRLEFSGTNLLIDWGDGNTETLGNFSGAVEHSYDYATQTGTDTSAGYRQAIVSITGDALSSFKLYRRADSFPSGRDKCQPILDIHVGSPSLSSPGITSPLFTDAIPLILEHIKFYSLSQNMATNWCKYIFRYCYSLQSVESNVILKPTGSAHGMFQDCRSLKHAPMIDFTDCTETKFAFSGCSSLKEFAGLLNFQNVQNAEKMFEYCASLVAPPDLDTSSVTNSKSIIHHCPAVRVLPAWDMSASNSTNSFTSAFSNTSAIAWSNVFGYRRSHDLRQRSLNREAIVNIFQNLGTAVSGATIKVDDNPGSSDLTPTDIAIATNKGWTVVYD